MSLVTLALLVALAVVVAALVYVIRRALALWRDLRSFSRAAGDELQRLADSLERLSAFEPPDPEGLSLAFGRMRASQERLSLLSGALGRVYGQWTGLIALAPKK